MEGAGPVQMAWYDLMRLYFDAFYGYPGWVQPAWIQVPVLALAALAVVATLARRRSWGRTMGRGALGALGVWLGATGLAKLAAAVGYFDYWGWMHRLTAGWTMAGIGVLAIAWAAAATDATRPGLARASRMIPLYFLAPAVFAFGSAMGVFVMGALAAVFVVSGIVALAAAVRVRREILELLLVGYCVTAVWLHWGQALMDWPIRVLAPTSAVEIGRSRIQLSPEHAAYLREIRAGLLAEGFSAGTPIIDLLGTHERPSAVSLVGEGVNVGYPYYFGSAEGARLAIEQAPRELRARAWIAICDDDLEKRALLRSLGLPFPEGYQRVVTARFDGESTSEVWKPRTP